ncbi:unnamed protein product, partial [Rotaria sordida]
EHQLRIQQYVFLYLSNFYFVSFRSISMSNLTVDYLQQ